MILSGLDVLLAQNLDRLKNRRVGLLTNPTGVTRDLRSNIDALRAAGVNLVALFSPEHGLLAAAADGAHVASSQDARTGLPVYSLYGATTKPTPAMLDSIDLLLYDIQDVGARFYTYTATLGLALQACAENKIPLIVLDRPNAINGSIIEGPVLDPALQSFVGHGPLPIRFGMTLGELAKFYNAELNIGAELEIIPVSGWTRAQWFDETGLPWVPPSPNMPHLTTATLYPGMCLFEGTNLSIGRGTPLPFEIFGAPFIDGHALADALNALPIDGARFRPTAFTPSANKFANENCFGVHVHITDRNVLRPVTLALSVLQTIRPMYPAQAGWIAATFNRLIGDASVMEKIDRSVTVSTVIASWAAARAEFEEKRKKYLLYTA